VSGTPRPGPARVALAEGEVEVLVVPGQAGSPTRPALVLLHEGLGSIGLWRGFPAALAERTRRTTVVWSRHGHGGSAPARLPRAVDYLHHEALAALPELLDHLTPEHPGCAAPVLVGHSDGASIALIHAGTSGRPVTGVVALAPHVVVEERSLAGIRSAREQYRSSDLPRRLARHHRDADATFWGWNDVWLSPAFATWNIEDILPGVTAPVLSVQCADDGYGTLDQLARVAAGVAGPVTELVLPTGGHSPHLAHPDTVAAAVAAFVADLPAPPL
jgi:pimeloyl-ACP methyl ester carboxylesterase